MKASRHHQMISGFYLENPVPALPALLYCGEALCSPRHRLEPHAHSGFEFVYLTRGAAFWQVRGRTVQQRMGDLLVTPPREPHATAREPGREFHLFWFGLDLSRLGGAGRRLAALLATEPATLLSHCHEVEGLMRGLFVQAAATRPLRARVMRRYLEAFLALVEQRLRLTAAGAGPVAPAAGLYSAGVQRAVDFMQANLDRRLAVRDVVTTAGGGSFSRFCARFRREVGESPGSCHLRLRLDAARLALRQPEASITHVALRYGFSSSQHFSMAFHRLFGVTPRAWRAGHPVRH